MNIFTGTYADKQVFLKIVTLENLLFIDTSFSVFLIFDAFVRYDITSLIMTPLVSSLCYIG